MSKKKEVIAPAARAVIYARYSSGGQREESIEGQLRECYDYAQRAGIAVIGEYIDRALTGRTDKRPDFQRMIKDSEKGQFNTVITWKIDRFARDRYDSALYKARLKKNGVSVVYAKETIPEGPEGIILESVMEGYAEYYSKNLSQNVKRGNHDSALELKTVGVTLIGFKKGLDGRFEIDEPRAAIVRRIFEEYANGETAHDIYTRLNHEGHKTSRGKAFGKSSLVSVLRNSKYNGVYEHGDVYVKDGIPKIIDDELFEKVQSLISRKKEAPAMSRGQLFLLTTKLFCGHCSEAMVGDSGTSRTGKIYSYYTCYSMRKHKCDKKRASKEWIEELVVNTLTDLIHSDEFVREVSTCVSDYQAQTKDTSVLESLRARLSENEKITKNVMAAIEQGIITGTTKSRLVELEAEHKNLECGIARELIAEPILTSEHIGNFIKGFRNRLPTDETYRIWLVDTFVNKIFLYDDKLVLTLNYTGSKSKITLAVVNDIVAKIDNTSSCLDVSGVPEKRRKPLFYKVYGVFLL